MHSCMSLDGSSLALGNDGILVNTVRKNISFAIHLQVICFAQMAFAVALPSVAPYARLTTDLPTENRGIRTSVNAGEAFVSISERVAAVVVLGQALKVKVSVHNIFGRLDLCYFEGVLGVEGLVMRAESVHRKVKRHAQRSTCIGAWHSATPHASLAAHLVWRVTPGRVGTSILAAEAGLHVLDRHTTFRHGRQHGNLSLERGIRLPPSVRLLKNTGLSVLARGGFEI
mmetsp:Transcript_6319/g.14441  ORF Transcript_6319/g.14441 Transcript_6319/m.14441 type:complete len:228 (-) Transcript_6319:1010-1693(-)